METKPRHQSKTHWAAGLITVLGVIVQNADQLEPIFGKYGGAVIAACGGIMAVLRELTKVPVGKPKEQ